MKMTPESFKIVEYDWARRHYNYATKVVHDADQQEQLFSNSPDAELYKYVPCPVCGESHYTIFHEQTKFRTRVFFGKIHLTQTFHQMLQLIVRVIGIDRTSSILSFLLRRNITPAKITNMNSRGYTVVQCTNCQLLYRNPTYKPKALDAAYNNNYLEFLTGAYTEGRQKKYHQALMNLEFFEKTEDYDDRKVLDVGCGYGLFLSYIREKGWEPYGLDFAADCIEYAQKELKLDNVAVGNLESDSFEENFFGAVTLWSVAAHLDDPIKMFSDIRRVLKPGGYFVIYTVNAESVAHKTELEYWDGFTKNHLVFFSKNTLTYALKKAGFAKAEDGWDKNLHHAWLKTGKIIARDLDYFGDLAASTNCGGMISLIAQK